MTSQNIQPNGASGKPPKRKSTYRRPPPLFSGEEWADTKCLSLDTGLFLRLTRGWPLERVGALLRLTIAAWSRQEHLPPDIATAWTTDEIRGRLGTERRVVKRLWDAEMQRAVAALTAKRAPLYDGGREWVFEKSAGVCHHCGAGLSPDNFHVDHLRPIAKGGLTHNDNLVASCPPCNLSKGGRLL